MEKGLSNNFESFGLTHEISFAYSFAPNLTEDRVMLEDDEDDLVDNTELTEDILVTNEEIEELKRKLAENDAIIEELMFRQDSIEANRKNDYERRFELVMRMVRNEINGTDPSLERKAKELFSTGGNTPNAIVQNPTNNDFVPNGTEKGSRPDLIQNRVKAETKTATTKLTVQDNTKGANYNKPTNRNPIKNRKFKNLDGVEDGYYVIANVYKGGHYLDKFIDDLGQKGIVADYIDNPDNGLKYVYLERFDSWKEAVDAHNSNLNGTYSGNTWIMNIDNRYSNEAYAENVSKLSEKSSKYDIDVLQKNVVVKDNLAGVESTQKIYKINGVGSGYYIIANVFANVNNANRFVKLLNSYGLSAAYFINPDNNYRYVYLKRHESWNNALISYYSKLNDAYDDKMWIMRVTPNLMT